jgi:prephenate dehydrogenase
MSLAGPGFRDFTRIAASDPKIWRDILIANKHQVLEQSRNFQRILQSLEQMIHSENGDALEGAIRQASDTRSHWRMSSANKK